MQYDQYDSFQDFLEKMDAGKLDGKTSWVGPPVALPLAEVFYALHCGMDTRRTWNPGSHLVLDEPPLAGFAEIKKEGMGGTNHEQLHYQLAAEHSRLHIVGSWPQSTQREVLLYAISSAIARFSRDDDQAHAFHCMICRTGKIVPLFSTGRLTANSRKVAA